MASMHNYYITKCLEKAWSCLHAFNETTLQWTAIVKLSARLSPHLIKYIKLLHRGGERGQSLCMNSQ